MNPFNWTGGQFLGFYAALAASLVAGSWIWTRFVGPASHAKLTDLTSDPYRIACLRKGHREAIRIAAFNLVDRGLLGFDGSMLRRLRSDAPDFLHRPLDRAIVAACAVAITPYGLLREARVRAEARKYAMELEGKGLHANEHQARARRQILTACLGILLGVALVKIAVALSRGHSNVFGLALLAIVASAWVSALLLGPANRAGTAMLRELQALTRRLKGRAKELSSGGRSNEAVLLAAVHGLEVLPLSRFPFLEGLYRHRQSSSSDGGSSCGSSGGSSSGGGSCGGGGGCGGCGS
jgi:uncharacterized protein (TIGR04222 family)